MPGYVLELDLRGRLALVVGLGVVGRRKARGVLAAGGRVRAVDPAPIARNLADGREVEAGAIEWLNVPYHAEHLQGASLAFAAGPEEVNRQVVRDAREAGVWVNSASDPATGDFTVPAVWRDEGDALTLAVSTQGASPALAAALRDQAVAALGPAAAGLAATFAALRPLVLERLADPAARRLLLADWANPRWLQLWADGGPQAVRDEVERQIDARGGESTEPIPHDHFRLRNPPV